MNESSDPTFTKKRLMTDMRKTDAVCEFVNFKVFFGFCKVFLHVNCKGYGPFLSWFDKE